MLRKHNKKEGPPPPSRGARLLRAYLELDDVAHVDFAAEAKLTPVELSHFLSGRRVPTLAAAVRLEDASKGAAPCRAWVE